MKNTDKGNLLESAVKEIEELIINNSALSKAKSFSILPKVRYYEKGPNGKKILLHEVDLLVSIDFGLGNELIQIIECKNWDCKSISKSQIIDFLAKIEYTGASKGYFIGKKYSPAAKLVAQSNKRIELLCFSSEKHLNIIHAPSIGKVENKINKKILRLQMNPFDNNQISERPIEEVLNNKIHYNNETCLFSHWLGYILEYNMRDMIASQRDKINEYIPGTIHFNCSTEIPFVENQLIYKEKSIKTVELDYSFDLDIYLTKTILKLDVESRGRAVNYELIHPTKKGDLKLITTPNVIDNTKWDAKLVCRIE